ncbi:MAG: protein kinase domain-containing protein [Acidimicrobiales bacterium]
MVSSEFREEPLQGRVLNGRYRLVAPLAKGGMAVVWEGLDEILMRPVAVKILRPHLAEDAQLLERFRREAVTAAGLVHPAIVATYDTGIDDGIAFIVMELVRGRTLRAVLDDHGALPPEVVVGIADQIADALGHAHRRGLVHRDVKPANVLVCDGSQPVPLIKVTDFGIAKASEGLDSDLTRPGVLLGTPKYLSPEQIAGGEPDARADLYALGVVCFEMLTGEPPFGRANDVAVAVSQLRDAPPHPAAKVPGVPGDLDALVVRLLAKDPVERPASAQAVRGQLAMLSFLGVGGGVTLHDGLVEPPEPFLPESLLAPSPSGQRPALGAAAPGPSAPVPSMPFVPSSPGGARRSASAGGDGDTGILFDFPRHGQAPPPPAGVSRPGPNDDTPHWGGPSVAPQWDDRGDRGDRGARRPSQSRRHPGRGPGLVVAALILAGVLVAVFLLSGSGPKKHNSGGSGSSVPPAGMTITSASVYMNVTGHSLDDPQGVDNVFDGNPSTMWQTDLYPNENFGNLYTGEGLAVELSAAGTLHQLKVTSPSMGWSAQTYVSETPIAFGSPVTAWGSPTDSQSNINGNATFTLGGRHGRYVLLWLTQLGNQDQASIAELVVS